MAKGSSQEFAISTHISSSRMIPASDKNAQTHSRREDASQKKQKCTNSIAHGHSDMRTPGQSHALRNTQTPRTHIRQGCFPQARTNCTNAFPHGHTDMWTHDRSHAYRIMLAQRPYVRRGSLSQAGKHPQNAQQHRHVDTWPFACIQEHADSSQVYSSGVPPASRK